MLTSHKTLVSFFLLVWLVALSGCGDTTHAPEEKYVLVASNVKLPYWQEAGAGLLKAAAQLGVKAEVVGPDSYDPQAQAEEFRRALGQRMKPTGILVSAADPALMQPEINAAVAQGIPVITIDADSPSSQRMLFVGTDNIKAGMMGARVLAKELGGRGGVVVYTMPGQANLAERMDGYREVLAGYPQIKILEVVDIKGDARIAFDRTMQIVEKGSPNPDAFVCLEAIACPEVAEVLDRRKITGKVVVAMDTDERTLEWIQKGRITATIGQKPYTMAFVGLKLLDDLHHNKPANLTANFARDPFSPLATFVDTGAAMVNKDNVAEFLSAREAATSR